MYLNSWFAKGLCGSKLCFNLKSKIFVKIMNLLNFVERQKWCLCANLAFQFFYHRWSVSLIYRIEIWSKKILKKGFIETPMGINKVSLKVFWFQKGYFVPNMTKIRFQIKPHIFFLFWNGGIQWNFDKKSADFTVLGVSEIENQRWISLKPGVFDWEFGLVKFNWIPWNKIKKIWEVLFETWF